MRPIWKGSISFGLVNIPVGLYSATKPASELKFRMVRDNDQSPIHYKRVAEADGKEVPWEHIVKAYEFEKGRLVTLTEEDFEQVNIKSNQTVDIKEFVDLKEIDPMFFEQPYFLNPEKGGAKAYSLLREALKQTGKVGIAKVTIKTREHLAAVKASDKALVLELMHFPDELADPQDLTFPGESVGKKELAMAETLVEAMSGKWKPEKYDDEYRGALMAVIEKKIAAGGKKLPPEKRPDHKATNVLDLMDVLQRSLAEKGKGKSRSARPTPAAKKRSKAA
ncbi:MAG TPA: Ku protein [Candidatus Eisenbacteria bacterium]|nr:Ku protein [Candidatus Eisenbacteria bacterium]